MRTLGETSFSVRDVFSVKQIKLLSATVQVTSGQSVQRALNLGGVHDKCNKAGITSSHREDDAHCVMPDKTLEARGSTRTRLRFYEVVEYSSYDKRHTHILRSR